MYVGVCVCVCVCVCACVIVQAYVRDREVTLNMKNSAFVISSAKKAQMYSL